MNVRFRGVIHRALNRLSSGEAHAGCPYVETRTVEAPECGCSGASWLRYKVKQERSVDPCAGYYGSWQTTLVWCGSC